MPTINEVFGLMLVVFVLLILLMFSSTKRKHKQKYCIAVVFYCKRTGNKFVTAVNSLDIAQVYANTLNLSAISAPMLINRNGYTTHTLEGGVWSPVSQ